MSIGLGFGLGLGRRGVSKQPAMIKYIFIDGGYILKVLEVVGKRYFGEPITLNWQSFSGGHEKSFFYDCIPDRKEEESYQDYERRIQPRTDLHDALRVLPGYHVFAGRTVREGRRQKQKGVDVMIAVHMLTHSFRRNMGRATLVAGDADFRPLLDSLVQEGMYTTLKFEKESAATELIQAADAQHALTPNYLWSLADDLFKARFAQPTLSLENPKWVPTPQTKTRKTLCGRDLFWWDTPEDILHVLFERKGDDNYRFASVKGKEWRTIRVRMEMEGLQVPETLD